MTRLGGYRWIASAGIMKVYILGDAVSYHLNIIILLSSYPFISLINCPWLLFIIILLTYSFMALSGFLFIYIIIAINYWIRDVIREYTKKYEVLIIMLCFSCLTWNEMTNNQWSRCSVSVVAIL